MKNFKKIKDIPNLKSIKYFRSSDLERTKKYYESEIPFEILYIETDSCDNYYLIKTPKNPFFIRYTMDGGSFCADKIHMRLINPYDKPLRYDGKDNFINKNVYINGEDAMYDDSFYYEFFKLIDSKTVDAFYLDYPEIHYAQYMFELSNNNLVQIKNVYKDFHENVLVIASKKYAYYMRAFFLNENSGGHVELKINNIESYKDGGTTNINLTMDFMGTTMNFKLYSPTPWKKEERPTLNSFEIKEIEDEKRKIAAIQLLGLKPEAEYL